MSKRLLLAFSSAGYLLALGGCGSPTEELMEEEATPGPLPVAELQLGMPGAHCVTKTQAVRVGQPSPTHLEPAARIDCFASFADAISFSTQGAVRLPPGATPESLTEEDLSVGTMATYVIGVEYEEHSYGGSSLTATSEYTCDGWNHSFSSMPSGWDNVISSARAYSGCNNSYHYEHTNFGGNVMNCRDYCSYIGSTLNDRTSSIRWTK